MSDQQQQQQQQPQSSHSPLDCSPWPHHHIHTGAEAAASFPEFCQAFGFPVGPSGSGSLLLFYELLDQSGALVQRGRVTGCTQLGQHPWAMLFAPHSYLCSVLDVCDSVSSVRLYTSHSPCEDPGSQCCSLLLSFLLFAQLHHIQHQGGPRRPAPPHPAPGRPQAPSSTTSSTREAPGAQLRHIQPQGGPAQPGCPLAPGHPQPPVRPSLGSAAGQLRGRCPLVCPPGGAPARESGGRLAECCGAVSHNWHGASLPGPSRSQHHRRH
ncbi:uncharacterized protein LOC125300929 [Alosa alosa]|uniref:uncharacterized protein LOC125300929 n=1 Tax=Alosa alosa TaxID=278164 RepID=UPI002015332C|nr:uncharacterized protein LOC125300929 [Alosa alosa]